MPTILVVDDEAAIRTTLSQLLGYEGYTVLTAADGPAALETVQQEKVDVILLDVKMPAMDGLEVLSRLASGQQRVPVIIISGHGTVETAVEAVRQGAYDFLEKPLERDRLLVTIRNCLDHFGLARETAQLRDAAGWDEALVGECPAMREVKEFIRRVAPTDATVLITGENGTGKELVVRALHAGSPRRDRPLVEVNCAAIPRDLVESELFGHEKGSFTGADKTRIGKFELADGGTLFLDEIGDMDARAQAKVLRAIEQGRFQRVGGTRERTVDVRIIAATNRDLTDPALGFRQDLFYRLNVLSVQLPPLRERGDDIELLLEHFNHTLARRLNRQPKVFTPAALDRLRAHDWPGNVRELRNLVERVLILVPGQEVDVTHLPMPPVAESDEQAVEWLRCRTYQEFKERSERAYLQAKLAEHGYNVSRTAEALGMQRSNLYKKIAKYDLRTSAGRSEPD